MSSKSSPSQLEDQSKQASIVSSSSDGSSSSGSADSDTSSADGESSSSEDEDQHRKSVSQANLSKYDEMAKLLALQQRTMDGLVKPDTGNQQPALGGLMAQLPPRPPGGYSRKQANKLFEASVDVPKRPGWCTAGTPIRVKSNSVAIKLQKPDLVMCSYDFQIEPPIGGFRLQLAYEQWRQTYFHTLVPAPDTSVTFDGKRNIYTSGQLVGINSSEPVEFHIAMKYGATNSDDIQPSSQLHLQKVLLIKLRLSGALPVRDLLDYLKGKAPKDYPIFSYTGIIDTILRSSAMIHLTPSGRIMFDRRQSQKKSGLEIVPGYTQAVRVGNQEILLIVDVTSAVFYEPLLAVDLLVKAFGPQVLANLTHSHIQQIRRTLRGMLVQPTYVDAKKRNTYTIQDLTDSAADSTFFNLENVSTSVAQYFEHQYNIKLKYPNLPCIIAKVPKRTQPSLSGQSTAANQSASVPQIYLPLELVVLATGQKATRSLGQIDHNHFKPSAMRSGDRANQIEKGLRSIYDPPIDLMTSFGLQPTYELMDIDARLLSPPKLLFHATSKEPTLVPKDAKWDMAMHRVYRGVSLKRWAVLPFVPCDPIRITKFIKLWAGKMRDLGIHVENHDPPMLPPADPEGNIDLAIQHAYLQAGSETKHPDLLVFILPNKGFNLYHGIKRACDVTFGVASQCITLKVVQDARMNHIDNLCLKVNVKLPGGVNLRLDPEFSACMTEIPTIFMGADVTHPAQEIRSPSIASVVGSQDALGSKYACATRIQPIREEIILDMGSCVLELLQKFYLNTGVKPQRVIFYRDGISEGQFYEVLRTEVTSIRKAFKALDPTYSPKLTFIIVQKRHHTRFFPGPGCPADKLGNPMPGLLVDRKATHPFEFDFYILSHLTLQGLAKPTRYSVLVDENQFNPDHLAELSFRSCYLYPRGSRSVSMVPAAFFAHVTAARAKAHVIDGERNGQRFFALSAIKPELDKLMFFM